MIDVIHDESTFVDGAAFPLALPILGAWLLTYLLHSTIFLSTALAMTALARGWSDSIRELVLRFALVGGIISATLTLLLPPPSSDASWWRDPFGMAAGFSSASHVLDDAAQPSDLSAGGGLDVGATSNRSDDSTLLAEIDPAAVSSLSPVDLAPHGRALAIMVITFAVGCALAMRTILLSHRRLRRELRNRQPLLDHSPAHRLLNELLRRCGATFRHQVRLSASEHLEVPIAMGILRPEICLPLRRMDQLDETQLRLMLAHELAHLVRRDPQWQLAYRIVESTLFFQPLNLCARRALRTIAEYQCDAWAADVTGERTRLARVLADVAQWLVAGNTTNDLLAPAASMAERRSAICSRIERLLGDPPAHRRTRRHRRGLAALACIGAIAALAAVSPQFLPQSLEPVTPSDFTSIPTTADAPAIASPALATGSLEVLFTSLDDELALLEAEANLLGARARAANADPETLALLDEILERIALVRAARADLVGAINLLERTPPESNTPSTPLTTGRKSP